MRISDVRVHLDQEGYIITLDGQHEYACPPGDQYFAEAEAIFTGQPEAVIAVAEAAWGA